MTECLNGYVLIFCLILAYLYWQPGLFLVPSFNLTELKSCSTWIFFAETEEKTEAATPHRQKESRDKGQVARSSDLNAAIVVMAVIVSLYGFSGYIVGNVTEYIQHIFSNEISATLSSAQFFNVYKLSLVFFLKIMAPIFAAAIIFGVLINILQVGMVIAFEGITPKLTNINPIEGFKRIFSKKALFEFLKTLLKVLVIGLITYNLIQEALPQILGLLNIELVSSTDYLIKLAFRIGITAIGAFLVIAVLDFVYQKWEFGQSLRMSKDEVKKEMKQNEGDPLIKSRIRQKQRLMTMNRMMQSIPEATVVVTNPTHLAVALKYDDKVMDAPQIVAKGAGYVAEKIKEKAVEYKIPIIEDKPLARSLYKVSEIGDFVPVELYQAVAGLIAAIYSLRK